MAVLILNKDVSFDRKVFNRQNSWRFVVLAMLCFLAFVPGLSTLPPTDRDESLFSQASRQMVDSGNYVDIRFQDKPRYQKPIGIYWLQSASAKLFQPDDKGQVWVYRVPSTVGITISVLMTAALGMLLFNPTIGFVAGLMLMGCTIVNVEARLATTDASLLAAITTMQFALACAWRGSCRWGNALLFWTALGVGVLLKGPIVLLPLVGTLLWLWRTEKTLAWFNNLKPLPGLVYLLLLVSPWFVAISMASHGAFMEQSAGKDLLAKIWSGQNRGIILPGFHLLIFPFMFFPFSLFTYMALPDIWKQRKESVVAFCLGWIVPTWIVFELSLTKLTHYTMPTFPAWALLSAWALVSGYPSLKSVFLKNLIATCWVLIGVAYAIAFVVLAFRFGGSLSLPGSWFQIGASLGLVLSQVFALLFFHRRQWLRSMTAASLGSLLFMTTVFSQTLPHLSDFWVSPQVVAKAQAASQCGNPKLITVDFDEPSIVLLGGTQTVLVDSVDAAIKAVKAEPCAVAAVEERFKDAFSTALQREAGLSAQMSTPVDSVTGFNLGNGHWANLWLFALPPHLARP